MPFASPLAFFLSAPPLFDDIFVRPSFRRAYLAFYITARFLIAYVQCSFLLSFPLLLDTIRRLDAYGFICRVSPTARPISARLKDAV